MKEKKRHKKKAGKRVMSHKEAVKHAEPERGFIPYCRRFANTWRSAYKDIFAL